MGKTTESDRHLNPTTNHNPNPYLMAVRYGSLAGKCVQLLCCCNLTFTQSPRKKVFRIGTVRYNWPTSAHVSQAFSIAHCTDSEDLPSPIMPQIILNLKHHIYRTAVILTRAPYF